MQRDFAHDADWSFFDRAYCISLAHREDRRNSARAQFARVGLGDRVKFVLAEKDREDPERGIYASHMLCLERGLAAEARHILIFEDDVVFARFSAQRLAGLCAFLREGGWDACFLGCIADSCRKLPGFPAARVRYRSLAHAYAVRRDFAEKLVRHPWQGVPYDDFLRDLRDANMFAACPSFAFQSDAASDNDAWLHMDRRRRHMGGLMFLQMANEFWNRFRRLIVALHFVALALLLWWLCP